MGYDERLFSTPLRIEPDKRFEGVWAKSPDKRQSAQSAGEALTYHTAWLLRNVERLHERTPGLCGYAEYPVFWPSLAMAAAAHDLGKCADGFQTMLRGGERFPYRHEVFSLALLPYLLGEQAESEHLLSIAGAVATHHKDIERILDQYLRPNAIEGQFESKSIASAWGIYHECLQPRLSNLPMAIRPIWLTQAQATPPEAAQVWAGLYPLLRALRDSHAEMRFDGAWSGAAKKARLLRGGLMIADHSGSAHIALQTRPEAFRQGRVHEHIGGFPTDEGAWFDHQRACSLQEGHCIVIAPTGSGKTEAALLWAQRQMNGFEGCPVLYYVLPYQASMNAMHGRLSKVFGEGRVTLQHSRAMLSVYRRLLADGDKVEPMEAVARSVHLRNLAQVQASTVRILSPYQLLKAAFGLRGHEAMWTALGGGLLVFDELHAYEPRRLGAILGLVEQAVRDLGVKVLAMSATFPAPLMRQLLRLAGESEEGIVIRSAPATFQKFRRHVVRLLEAGLMDEAVLQRIRASAGAGLAVLVTATTVARAQQLYTLLEDLEPELLHGRFHIRDRSLKESGLLKRIGAGGARSEGGKPVVLIATQVVEVSLNVDFDVLYSDPAPLEALLQRFGRVNRKQGGSVDPKEVFVCTLIPECRIYRENLILGALEALRTFDGQVLPEDRVQGMLDEVYAGDYGAEWESEVAKGRSEFRRNVLESCLPMESHPELEKEFERLFDGAQVLPGELESEYDALQENEPFAAPEILVPVTTGQLGHLNRKGLLRRRSDGVLVARCVYGREGLVLDAPLAEDGI